MFEFKSIPTPGPVRPGDIGGGRLAPTYYHDFDFFDKEKYPDGTDVRCIYSKSSPGLIGLCFRIGADTHRKCLDQWQRDGARFEYLLPEVSECQ